MPEQVQLGKITLTLDSDVFRKAYSMGRELHFDTCEEEVRQATAMTVDNMMRLVAVPNDEGLYEFDDDSNQAEEIVGFVIGYMSGTVIPEAPQERHRRKYRCNRDTEQLPIVTLREP